MGEVSMSGRRIEIDPELMAQCRQLYENTLTPTRDIAIKMGLSRNTLDNRIAEWKWQRRKYTSGEPGADAPGTDVAVAERAPPPVQSNVQLPADFAGRLQRIINAHCEAVERTIKVINPQNDAEAERSTRTLATIARAIAEITATATAAGQLSPNEADDDPVPRDIDEFRFELARRIRGFIEARQTGPDRVSGDPEGQLG
jgi:hypothetical protein